MLTHDDFLRLFVTHEPQLRVLVASLIRDRHERDDVLQELALVLWREFARYDPTRPFGAWARGVAGNLILNRWRQSARTPAPFSPEVVSALLDACERRAAQSDDRLAALEHCLQRLPPKSRALLALRYERELKLSEIAEQTDGTLQGIHKTLARMRERLQACVQARLATAT